MRRTTRALIALTGLAALASTAPAASAGINGPTSGVSASNTGPAAGSTSMADSFGMMSVTCGGMAVSGAVHDGSTLTLVPTQSSCVSVTAGVGTPATAGVGPGGCKLRLTLTGFNAATGVSAWTLVFDDGVDHHLLGQPDVPTCSDDDAYRHTVGACIVKFTEQTATSGVQGQNYTATNQPSPAGGPPARMRITANLFGLAGIAASCPGLPPGHQSIWNWHWKLYFPNHYVS